MDLLAAQSKRMQRCRPKKDLKEKKKNLNIQASESNTLCPIIQVFIRADGAKEWFIRSVFNLKVSLHYILVQENRKQCLLRF